jgi:hypothetical protein
MQANIKQQGLRLAAPADHTQPQAPHLATPLHQPWLASPGPRTHLGEDALDGVVGHHDDVAIELGGVEAQRLVEG